MTQKKIQEPKQDWGFYAVTPRVVRTKYKDLSHAEKWLYTCLKDLCGDKGACFRSLRALSEETDISIASLSKMVPNLHKAGLIHAEKKRRSKSGKEIWHITIADIWQENAKHCKDCSIFEQSHEGTTEVVQNMNKNASGCSENEQSSELDCSNFSDRRISKNKDTEEGTYGTDDSANPNASLSFLPSLSSLSDDELLAELHRRKVERLSTSSVDNSAQNGDNQPSSEQDNTPHHIANPAIENVEPTNSVESLTTRNTASTTNARRTDELDPANLINLLSEDELRIHGYWLDLGFDADVTPTLKTHWGKLVRHIANFEQMKTLYEYARSQLVNAKDPTVHPGNLVKGINGWKQAQAPFKQPDKKPRSASDPLAKYKAIGAQFINQGVN